MSNRQHPVLRVLRILINNILEGFTLAPYPMIEIDHEPVHQQMVSYPPTTCRKVGRTGSHFKPVDHHHSESFQGLIRPTDPEGLNHITVCIVLNGLLI